ncbi:MAG: exo-alpha-sialidase, partial [Planctomycetes bacterium]|nr:exo-alpha-sialidase [Planctomycetota bacterium]
MAIKKSQTYRHFHVSDSDQGIERLDPIPRDLMPLWANDVSQSIYDWTGQMETAEPHFPEPIPFVIPPPTGSAEPFYSHNHCPAISWCENGDLLTIWFSTEEEAGTEMTILASRFRAAAEEWDPASEFFKAENRNMTGSAVFNDSDGTLYHFNGMGMEGAQGWEHLALLMRSSDDNGVTWTPPRPISSGDRYQRRHQVIAGTTETPDGVWVQPCDGTPEGQGPTAIHISSDKGRTWVDPGGDIRGIHAGVVGLGGGRLLAFGRGQPLEGRMPESRSDDLGRTWRKKPSPFPAISSAQRLVLLRLREGPLLFVSFTDAAHHKDREQWQGMEFENGDGQTFVGYGMFAVLSFDDGQTWPVRKLMTPGSGTYDGGAWTGEFSAGPTMAEPKGYLAATQTPDLFP